MHGDIVYVMAACHSLEPLEVSGELVGESLELGKLTVFQRYFLCNSCLLVRTATKYMFMSASCYDLIVLSAYTSSACDEYICCMCEHCDCQSLGLQCGLMHEHLWSKAVHYMLTSRALPFYCAVITEMYGATGWSQIQRHGTSNTNGHNGDTNSGTTAFDSVVAASHMDVPTFCQAIVTPPVRDTDKVRRMLYIHVHTH
jgi:hypothetical protein